MLKTARMTAAATWYTTLLAGPAVGVLLASPADVAEACTQPNGPTCGCGCSSNCTGYAFCDTITNGAGCTSCVITGADCDEHCSGGSSGSGGY
jgi:hypothetical protein